VAISQADVKITGLGKKTSPSNQPFSPFLGKAKAAVSDGWAYILYFKNPQLPFSQSPSLKSIGHTN